MKRSFLILFMANVPLLCCAQFQEIQLLGGPNYTIKSGSKTFESSQDEEKGLFRYNFGLQTCYKLNDRLSLRSGIVYYKHSIDLGEYEYDGFYLDYITQTQDFHFLGLPLHILVQLKKGSKSEVLLVSGFTFKYLLSEEIKRGDRYLQEFEKPYTARKINASFNIGFEYAIIKENLRISVNPFGECYLITIKNNNIMPQSLLSLGVNFGVGFLRYD